MPISQPCAAVRHRVGDTIVTAVNDGFFEGSLNLITNIERAKAARLLHDTFRADPPRLTVNAFLIENAEHVTLIDTGAPRAMAPTLGGVISNLSAIGVTPDKVGTVLLTHLHPDHVSGLIDANGAAVFPNAELVMNGAEHAFWHDDGTMAKAGDDGRPYFEMARRCVAPYAKRTRLISDGATPVPGITAMALPGHTPGHTGYLVASGNESLLIWADIVHLPGIQFAEPKAGVIWDVDGAQAVSTRERILDRVASDRMAVAGMHLDFPTFGHVARQSQGYAFIPTVWFASV
jgi:glyoxylase-like metal-dependent hydrolase (beta-lactamase superfamily II)